MGSCGGGQDLWDSVCRMKGGVCGTPDLRSSPHFHHTLGGQALLPYSLLQDTLSAKSLMGDIK